MKSVGSLSGIEKEELKIKGNKQEAFRLVFTIIPPELFKEIFLELGVTVFNAAIFRKEQFDFFINLIDGIESEEDMQFMRDKLEERRLKKLAEDREYDEKIKQKILKENVLSKS